MTDFETAVAGLRVPGMGTEAVAPFLANLIRLTRPRRVLEVGTGYTTPFLAAALAEVEGLAARESAALAAKTRRYLDDGAPLDDDWLRADPPLAAPASYLEPYRPVFVAVDDHSIPESSAGRVAEVLAALGLADRVTTVDAALRDCDAALPPDFAPIDLAWVDAWDCLYFLDHFLDRINPDGGVVVLHYLMTYPEGEAILRYLAGLQRARPGELEVLNLLEPHKLRQNSVTMIRRSVGPHPRYAGPGGRIRYDGALGESARDQAGTVTPPP
ncbi:class I SAM-dependent methyltransferase [Streptomyces sp. NPDC085614]|uniref:class I SAM-dependent methyltransferase n=1 Tax=unclassified Streptomyces TaxID=2593676 RepID=UPI001C9C9B36|nr:class I SAM-dependent methyltransferase [Streptomyces sp. ms191]